MKVLITGDSHVAALAKGLDASPALSGGHELKVLPLGPGDAFFSPFYRREGDRLTITGERCKGLVTELPVPAGGYSAYGFSGPFHLHPIVFDGFFIRNPPAPVCEGPTSASVAMIRRIILDRKAAFLSMLVELKGMGQEVFVIESPLMFRHHEKLAKIPSSTRLYLGGMIRDVIGGFLASHRIPVVQVPAECYDDEGFMLERFRHEDPEDQHHANAAWGRLMIDRVLASLPFPPSA